jgi:translation initiation factor 2 beta subunit (eIF-2beta)/eIF-5
MVSTPTAGMVDSYIEFFTDLCQTGIVQKYMLRRNDRAVFHKCQKADL